MKEAQNKININKKVLDEIEKRKNGNFNLVKNDFNRTFSISQIFFHKFALRQILLNQFDFLNTDNDLITL